MSIRKVSDLDSYLSADESFQYSNFEKSLFEISKVKDGVSPAKFDSRNIDGKALVDALYFGLSPYFANISALSAFSKKLALVLDLFETNDPNPNNMTCITNVNFTGPTILSCTNIIEGTARKALWS